MQDLCKPSTLDPEQGENREKILTNDKGEEMVKEKHYC